MFFEIIHQPMDGLICRMRTELEHVIHRKYWDKTQVPVQLNIIAAMLRKIFWLVYHCQLVSYVWPGEEPERKSINLYPKDKLSKHIYKSLSLLACIYLTMSLYSKKGWSIICAANKGATSKFYQYNISQLHNNPQ